MSYEKECYMKTKLLKEQKNEITAYHLYKKLSENVKNQKNAKILKQISDDEMKHYYTLMLLTKKDVNPNKVVIFIYFWICMILGLTFGIKLLEKNEDDAVQSYEYLSSIHNEINSLLKDEEEHERLLIEMINEDKLNYLGSVVLGLNDALVELTGALAGYTFAFQKNNIHDFSR